MCFVTSTLILVTMVTVSTHSKSDIGMVREDNRHYGASTETIEQHLKHLSEGKFDCHFKRSLGRHEMMKHYIRNKTVTCNDGSPSGYYLRRSLSSHRWLIYLDGGWFCHDLESCRIRWQNTPALMTSKNWPPTKSGMGIMSTHQHDNPLFHDANIVYVPYCSSDAWSGSNHPKSKGDYAFLGSLILENVIEDLIHGHGLADAVKMFLAGSSAGGTGVIINLDRVAGLMSSLAPRVEVRGIVDSGWFLDNKQYKRTNCQQIHSCAPTESIQRGIQLWGGVLPVNCLNQHPRELWRCYFGYRVYPTLKTPVFVIQHLFDEAQVMVDNVGTPVQREQWQYIHAIGQDMRRTLANVSAVFAPACLSHILLTRGEWLTVSINGVTLPEAIACWEEGSNERNLYSRKSNGRSNIALAERLITGIGVRRTKEERLLADSPVTVVRTESPSPDSGNQRKAKSKKRRRLERQRERQRRARQKERERKRKEKTELRQRQREERKALEDLATGNSRGTPSPRQETPRGSRHSRTKSNRREVEYSVNSPETEFNFDITNKRTRNRQRSNADRDLVIIDREKNSRRTRRLKSGGREVRNRDRTESDSFRTGSQSSRLKRALTFDDIDVHHMKEHGNSCSHRKIDHCEWPQCNFSCPKIYHPFTGEEMDFMDLFMQFGLDPSAISEVLNLEEGKDPNAQQDLLRYIFIPGK